MLKALWVGDTKSCHPGLYTSFFIMKYFQPPGSDDHNRYATHIIEAEQILKDIIVGGAAVEKMGLALRAQYARHSPR